MDWSNIFDGAATAASAAAAFAGQERANRQNKDIWRKTQDWNEMMSNTAWQRGVADMRKAGINPMLAVSQGGASSPTSSIGAPMQESTSRTVSSAIQAQSLLAQLRKNEADINEAKSRTALNVAQTASTSAVTAKARATQPVYNLLQDIVKSAVSTAKDFHARASKGGSINLSKGIFGK